MAEQRITFANFTGDWLGVGSILSENQFSGHNVHVYENGSVGPRPGWEERTWSAAPLSTKPLKGITWFKGSSTYGELVVVYEDGTNIDIEQFQMSASADLSATADTATITEATTPDPPSVWNPSWVGEPLFPLFSDGSKTIGVGSRFYQDFSATSYTANLGSGYATGSLIYRDRVFYWGFDNFPGRVYYSDAAAYDTVQATSNFDVCPHPSLAEQGAIGVWNLRDALLIARRDGVWMAMYGTNPDDGVLREIGHGVIPDHGVAVADMDNTLWFLKPNGTGVAFVTPSGVNVTDFDQARPGREVGNETGMPVGGPQNQQALRGIADLSNRSLVLPYIASNTTGTETTVWFLCRINGRWVQESFTHDTAINEVDFTMMGDGVMAMCIRDTSGYRLFTRRIVMNRPARDTGDDFSDQLTAETSPDASLVLPEVIFPQGQHSRIREVIVDFDYWQAAAAYDAPAFDIVVKARGAYIDGATTQEKVLSTTSVDGSAWPDPASATVPERRRETVNLGPTDLAASAQVVLDNLVSVAIRAVHVVYDTDEPRQ